jgi:PTH2 family peptidyl-tRNA hydrolase
MAQYVQYLVANKGLGMSSGKLAAQVAHAAVKGFMITCENPGGDASADIIAEWDRTGHTKIVLEARDRDHLEDFKAYAESRGFRSWLVIDEGRTEVAPHSPTALGFPILDKRDEDVAFTFGDLRTYREKPRERFFIKLHWFQRRSNDPNNRWIEVEAPPC